MSAMTKVKKEKELKTQEELLHERTKSGKLPVIDIVGHPFYVDTRMQTLRPHDDFSTLGIPFSVFDEYEHSDEFAWIPYDPVKHELKEVDTSKLTELPKDWFFIELPHPWALDPYGYARDFGWNIEETLKEHPIQANLMAKIVRWEDMDIPEIIRENLKKQKLERKHIHKNSQPIVSSVHKKWYRRKFLHLAMRPASLLSGIDGFGLAALWMGWQNVFSVEIDTFCRRVLAFHLPSTT